jgi:PAS domain-containing protein
VSTHVTSGETAADERSEPVHRLTLRTAVALGRLAELQRQADATVEKRSSLTVATLQEVSTALQELQVVNEHLEMQLEEFAAIRMESTEAETSRDRLAELLPIAVLWTDSAGVIEKTNEGASELFGVAGQHVTGILLTTLLSDEPTVSNAISGLCEPGRTKTIDLEVIASAGDGRHRRVLARGCRLEHDPRRVWFLYAPSSVGHGRRNGSSDRPSAGDLPALGVDLPTDTPPK